MGGLGHGKNPLESFFPFDPYLLRRSYAYIGEIYSEWSGREDRERSDDDGDVDSSEQNGSESEDTPESPSSASLLQMPVRRRTMSMGAQSDEVDDNFHELQPVTDEPARKPDDVRPPAPVNARLAAQQTFRNSMVLVTI